jgi:serine phosphatase RsbU (regulator of sigma subunit)
MTLRFMVKLWLSLLPVLAVFPAAWADQPLLPMTLSQHARGESLTPFLGIIRGAPMSWGPAEVFERFQAGDYAREYGQSVNFGLDFSSKWVHFSFTNPSPFPQTILIENNTTITDRLELFQKQDDSFVLLDAQGEAEPISKRPIISRQPVFRLEAPPGHSTYLIHLEADNVVQLGLKVWTEGSFHQNNSQELMTISLLLGFHIVIALYNFFLFVSVRDRMYLIYVAYVLCNVIYQSTALGIMQYVNHIWFGWETLPNWIMIASVDGVILSALVFSHAFLSLHLKLPALSHAMKFCGFISVLNIAINLFISNQTAAVICLFNSIFAVSLLLMSGLYLCWKRYRPAYFFTLAWVFYLTGASGNIFSLIGLIPAYEMSTWVQLYGGSFEIVLLSLAVGTRMSQIQTRLTKALTEHKQIEEVVRSAQFLKSRELEPTLPDFLKYTFYSRTAENIGGDFVGMVNHPEEQRIYIYLGDVMGHGLSPALMSAIAAGATRGAIQSSLHRQLGESERVLQIIHSINEALYERCQEADCFMSLALLSLNWQSGEICHVNAGHTPLFQISAEKIHTHILPGSLIGMFQEPVFNVRTFTLQPGHSIFLYTDGLIENTSPQGKPLRLRMIQKALLNGKSLDSCRDALIQMMNEHWRHQPAADDSTFFILRLEDRNALPHAS